MSVFNIHALMLTAGLPTIRGFVIFFLDKWLKGHSGVGQYHKSRPNNDIGASSPALLISVAPSPI